MWVTSVLMAPIYGASPWLWGIFLLKRWPIQPRKILLCLAGQGQCWLHWMLWGSIFLFSLFVQPGETWPKQFRSLLCPQCNHILLRGHQRSYVCLHSEFARVPQLDLPCAGSLAGRGEFSILAESCNYRGDQREKTSGHAPLPLIEGNDSSGLQSNTADLLLIN